jgi:hypothetical protein
MKNEKKSPKILFYTTIPRIFRPVLLCYLYEISQVYPVVLLSEKLDSETEELLKDKKSFPLLEKIIPVRQFPAEEKNLFSRNKRLYGLAKKVVEEERPDVMISPSDVYSLFEMYLMRFAKRTNSVKIALQPCNVGDGIAEEALVDRVNARLRFSSFLPLGLRLFLVKCRKYLGHFLYYWILPLSLGQKPFFGKSSFVLRRGKSGMRDADYQTVFSARDYEFFLKGGVPAEKLCILPQPFLNPETRKFFDRYNGRKKKGKNKAVAVMLPGDVEFGFRRKDYSLISKEEREAGWLETVRSINRILPGWTIYVKPHPATIDLQAIKGRLEAISQSVKIVNPESWAEKYIEIADVIMELPLSASNAVFIASLQCPEKPVISLDFYHELLGDRFRDFEGIEYINDKEKFFKTLELIRDNKYKKEPHLEKKKEENKREFSNVVEMLTYFLKRKQNKTKLNLY